MHDCITTGSSVTNIIWLIGATGSFKMTESNFNSEHVFLHIFTVVLKLILALKLSKFSNLKIGQQLPASKQKE